MYCIVPALTLMVALTGQVDQATTVDRNLIDRCFLVAIDEVWVPATEAGMLASIDVEEGDSVTVDQIVAKIDERDAVMAKKVAYFQYRASKEQAENEISIEAAVKSYEVAKAELDSAEQSNRKVPGTYSENDVRRLRLTWQRSGLQADLARVEQSIARADAHAKAAQYEQAEMMIERRQLKSPHAGVVMQITRHKGDWVSPGDPVLHIVRMDRLRVHGRVSARDHSWNDVKGQQVEFIVDLPGGRESEPVKGRIDFASQVVEADGSFRVWSDIDNPTQSGAWMMGPGLKATMRLLGK